ncbi:hypothetical protein CSV61_11450 [Sporosarcina sp. P3]|uniref:SH3 domain-containing protein n=1 Tax=Sporosarcina sp. P3 TaxID=2048245 RepID=UPI000C168CC3|nr:SH3 domain-containing protein [Sporosarcina sp. P3]PID21093.1 hypothetical protein CSV61_11450 [Sporosarcina sp. P3]
MEKRSDSSKKTRGNKKIIVLSVLSVVVLVVGVFLFMTIKDNRMVKKADSLVAIGKFDNGIAIYDHLLTANYSDRVMEKRERALELKEANEQYELGMESLDTNDRYKAIKHFSKIPDNGDELFQKATKELENIEEASTLEIEELMENRDFEAAYEMVNNYLRVAPASSNMKDLKDTLIATEEDMKKKDALAKEEEDKKVALVKAEEEKQAKAIEDEKRSQEAKAAAAAKNKELELLKLERARIAASNVLYTYQTVVTSSGNLRAAPTLNGKVLVALPRGTEVYIVDTQVESTERTWCKVEVELHGSYYTGWISYNTMNYSLP